MFQLCVQQKQQRLQTLSTYDQSWSTVIYYIENTSIQTVLTGRQNDEGEETIFKNV